MSSVLPGVKNEASTFLGSHALGVLGRWVSFCSPSFYISCLIIPNLGLEEVKDETHNNFKNSIAYLLACDHFIHVLVFPVGLRKTLLHVFRVDGDHGQQLPEGVFEVEMFRGWGSMCCLSVDKRSGTSYHRLLMSHAA